MNTNVDAVRTAQESVCSWVPLWPYALAVHSSGKRLQTDLMASGVPVAVIAGEPQVRKCDVEAFFAARQREAEARANLTKEAIANRSTPNALRQLLNAQAIELERLSKQVDALRIKFSSE